MNKELRKIFIPYFLYVELRTIFICLRQAKQDPNSGKTFDLLKSSLLSDEVKKLFMSNPNAGSAVKSLGRMFTPLSEKFAGWSAIFESGGLRALEQHIANTYLAVTAEKRLHPVMKNFFQHLIDARNIMAVYKYNRLEQSIHPPIIPGGKIPLTRFRSILVSGDSFGLNSLIEKFFGMKIETPEPTRVETALYTGITRFLKKESREHPVEGFILDYLWKCSLQVMNVSVVLTGKDLEREAVIAEIVQ